MINIIYLSTQKILNFRRPTCGMWEQLWGGEFWSDGGYVGTVGDGVTADIIRNYVEKQGTKEEKDAYKQMNLLDFK